MLIAAFAAAALLPLVVAEAGCRWWLRRRSHYYVWPPWMRLEIRPVPEAFPGLERRVRFDINAGGERGGQARDGEAGLYRILSVAGSAVDDLPRAHPHSWA